MKISTKIITTLLPPLLLGSNIVLAASAPSGFVVMRAYVPHNDQIDKVPLPTITFEYKDGTKNLIKPCPAPTGVTGEIANFFTEKQPECAWFLAVGGERFLDPNVALPDTSSTYWVTSFIQEDKLERIIIKGQYPNARYFSFSTYTAKGSKPEQTGMTSSLPDYMISPDSGSVNPWKQSSITTQLNTYTISIQRAPNPSSNVLLMPQPEVGGLGEIIDSMPSLNCSNPDSPDVIKLCNNEGFSRPLDSLLSSVFPNHDSAYLIKAIKPDVDTVWVVQGLLPRTAKGDSPVVWPNYTNYDLRYFSICNNELIKPYRVVKNACVKNDDLNLTTDGKYTVVLGNVPPKKGHNQLPVSLLIRYNGILIRNMVADSEFPNSILKVDADSNPSSAISVMGKYYPQIKKCTKTSYLLKGADCKY